MRDQGYNAGASVIYQDNQSAILLEENGCLSSGKRTKHIDVRYFFIKDRISRGEIKFEHRSTDHMIADFFTKPLQGKLFQEFRKKILNQPNENTE